MFFRTMFSDHKSNHARVLKRLIEAIPNCQGNVTTNSFKEYLAFNPRRGSMQGLLDSLLHFNFKGAGFDIDLNAISDLNTPFIAHLKNERSGFVTVINKDEHFVEYYNGATNKVVSTEVFGESWSGNVLVAEAIAYSGDRDYEHNVLLNRISLLKNIVIIALVIFTNIFSISNALQTSNPFVYLALILICQVGLYASLALTSINIEKFGSNAKIFCPKNEKSDCESVLNSKGSKLFGIFSWAEIGILYFGTLFIGIVLSGATGELVSNLSLLSLVSVCSAPYPIYSIYYQKYVVKSWCLLCLTVQASIVLMCCILVPYFPGNVQEMYISPSNGLAAGLIFLAWNIIKPLWEKAAEVPVLKENLSRFKMNHELFNIYHEKQERIVFSDEVGLAIHYGASANSLLVVMNLYCGPCRKSFEKVLQMINNKSNINIRLGFITFDNYDDKMTILLAHMMALVEHGFDFIEVLSFWFLKTFNDYETFKKHYPVLVETRHLEKSISHGLAIDVLPISSTPEYFLNNKLFSDLFDLDNLEYLLVDPGRPFISVFEENTSI